MGSEGREGNPMDEFRRREAGRRCVDQLVLGFRILGGTKNDKKHIPNMEDTSIEFCWLSVFFVR